MSSFSSFADVEALAGDSTYSAADELFFSQPVTETTSPPSIYSAGDGLSRLIPEPNGSVAFAVPDGPILTPPAEMQSEEGSALREWRRLNTIRLLEKEKEEKEMLREIIEEAEEYKAEFNKKWKVSCENNKAANREKEKLNLASQEKFHNEASKTCWRAIAELIPKEVPTIEKKGKKDRAKKPSVIVIQGPKPGKPTELSRMRQLLVKLKHNPPPHMKPPPPSSESGKDAKSGSSNPAAAAPTKPVALASREVVASA